MSRGFYFVVLCGLIVSNVLVYRAIFAPSALTITILDVAKGDATLLQTPGRKTILIDTGGDASILRALGTALPFWQRRIDAVVLTSDKTASVGGLTDVENRYHVSQIIHVGGAALPYGSTLTLNDSRIKIISVGTFTVSYGSTSFSISSSTPKGVYPLDGGKIISTR